MLSSFISGLEGRTWLLMGIFPDFWDTRPRGDRDSPSPTWALPGCEKASGCLGQLEQELQLASTAQGELWC